MHTAKVTSFGSPGKVPNAIALRREAFRGCESHEGLALYRKASKEQVLLFSPFFHVRIWQLSLAKGTAAVSLLEVAVFFNRHGTLTH